MSNEIEIPPGEWRLYVIDPQGFQRWHYVPIDPATGKPENKSRCGLLQKLEERTYTATKYGLPDDENGMCQKCCERLGLFGSHKDPAPPPAVDAERVWVLYRASAGLRWHLYIQGSTTTECGFVQARWIEKNGKGTASRPRRDLHPNSWPCRACEDAEKRLLERRPETPPDLPHTTPLPPPALVNLPHIAPSPAPRQPITVAPTEEPVPLRNPELRLYVKELDFRIRKRILCRHAYEWALDRETEGRVLLSAERRVMAAALIADITNRGQDVEELYGEAAALTTVARYVMGYYLDAVGVHWCEDYSPPDTIPTPGEA